MNERDEAVKAIEHVAAMLARPEALSGLERRLALATLDHAKENVLASQEVKRHRKAPGEEKADA